MNTKVVALLTDEVIDRVAKSIATRIVALTAQGGEELDDDEMADVIKQELYQLKGSQNAD